MVCSTPRPHFNPMKGQVPILQEAGWAPGPVWTGGKSRPHRDSIPNRPVRSQSLYRLSYPPHKYEYYATKWYTDVCVFIWRKCEELKTTRELSNLVQCGEYKKKKEVSPFVTCLEPSNACVILELY